MNSRTQCRYCGAPSQATSESAPGICASCAAKRTEEAPVSSSELLKELRELRARHEELARTVKDLQAKTEITEFMYEWARLADKIEVEKQEEDLETLVGMMTPTGTCDFPENWMGIWGPDKQDIKGKFRTFAAEIKWAYHVYPNAVIRLNWGEGVEGTAEYSTVAELVPIRIGDEHKILFLHQNSLLWRVNGQWKMHRYQLRNLVEAPLPPPGR